MQKSQWKIDFLPIFSPIFQDFCHFLHLWNIPKFLGLAWGGVVSPGLGGGVPSSLGGAGGLYKSLIMLHDIHLHAVLFLIIKKFKTLEQYFKIPVYIENLNISLILLAQMFRRSILAINLTFA